MLEPCALTLQLGIQGLKTVPVSCSKQAEQKLSAPSLSTSCSWVSASSRLQGMHGSFIWSWCTNIQRFQKIWPTIDQSVYNNLPLIILDLITNINNIALWRFLCHISLAWMRHFLANFQFFTDRRPGRGGRAGAIALLYTSTIYHGHFIRDVTIRKSYI